MQSPVYVVDTSTWIHLDKVYPASVFPSLARRCEEMIRGRRMLSHRTVLDEIRMGNDELVMWADQHRRAFVARTGATDARAAGIARDHPSLGGYKSGHDRADPYLIALALSIREGIDGGPVPVIVTEESQGRDKRIPRVAGAYGIDSCSTLDMFRREGWAF